MNGARIVGDERRRLLSFQVEDSKSRRFDDPATDAASRKVEHREDSGGDDDY